MTERLSCLPKYLTDSTVIRPAYRWPLKPFAVITYRGDRWTVHCS